MRLISADFLVLLSQKETKENNSIVLDNDVLVDYGSWYDLKKCYPEAEVEQHQGVIMPALVNAHCHLELSAFGTIELSENTTFTEWVERLIRRRAKSSLSEKEIYSAYIQMAIEQYRQGVCSIIDIANNPPPSSIVAKRDNLPEIISMREVIAPTQSSFRSIWAKINSTHLHVTAHAPYSVIPEALCAIKEHCRQNNQIFSIHTAETTDEEEFLCRSTGIFRQFLEERNAWDGSFDKIGSFPSSIQYFDSLDILDSDTLLVHCCNLSDDDYAILEKRQPAVCLCLGSNDYLGVGRANLQKLQEVVGGRICLGTDSIASNRMLDIWQEMTYLYQQNRVSPADILRMASVNGMAFLGKYTECGRVKRGEFVSFLVVDSPQLSACRDLQEIEQVLVSAGCPKKIIHL